MKIEEIIAVLRSNPLFRPVRQDRLRFMVLSAAEQKLTDGEMLFDRGDDGDAAYVVLTGAVRPIIRQGGRDIALARLGPGELFGEIAVLCDKPRMAAIIADGPTSIMRLESEALSDLLQEFPDLALEFIRSLAARLEATSLALAEAKAVTPN